MRFEISSTSAIFILTNETIHYYYYYFYYYDKNDLQSTVLAATHIFLTEALQSTLMENPLLPVEVQLLFSSYIAA